MILRALKAAVLAIAVMDGAAPPAAAAGMGEKSAPVTAGDWRCFAGAPPDGWSAVLFDDRPWLPVTAWPVAPRPPPLVPPLSGSSATLYDLVPGQPLLLRGRFAAADAARVRVLELAVAYADGFVAYVNGQEVARRGMAVSGAAAASPHGPEVEHVYVPVPSPGLPSLRPAGNVLALAVYAHPTRNAVAPSAPAVAVEVMAATGVRIVRGPYLTAPTDDGARAGLTVRWETDLPATGTLAVEPVDPKEEAPGRKEKAPRPQAARPPATRQAMRIGGLARGAAYRYRVTATAEAGDTAVAPPARFETLPAPPAKLRFFVYGDMRYPGHEAHRTVVEALLRESPTVVFNTGDLTDVGSEESNWQRYFQITAPLGAIAPIVPALGNHDADRRGAGALETWALFGVPASAPPGWTSLDLGGVHFVILSSNDVRDPAQVDWLKADLARARRHHARAIFAFCHDGPWSHGLHGGSSAMAQRLAPVLAAAHVDVLFSGHDHLYERGVGTTPTGKLTYVVSGGGGAPLYDPSCRLAVSATAATAVSAGGATLPDCPASVAALEPTYHYIAVEVDARGVTLCPRRPDGSPVEACVHLSSRR